MIRFVILPIMLLAVDSLSARAMMWEPDPGIYTNEEQVYFQEKPEWAAAPWIGVRIDRNARGEYSYQPIDRFGKPIDEPDQQKAWPLLGVGGRNGGDIRLRIDAKNDFVLRRARPATCWVAVRKDSPDAGGTDDWMFLRDVKLHDQGGRAFAGGGTSGAQPVIIRMRNVVWPPNADGTPATNKPSIVLYVHKPGEPDRAESYAWADPGAARIGINLRWMQASCGIDGAEQPKHIQPIDTQE